MRLAATLVLGLATTAAAATATTTVGAPGIDAGQLVTQGGGVLAALVLVHRWIDSLRVELRASRDTMERLVKSVERVAALAELTHRREDR